MTRGISHLTFTLAGLFTLFNSPAFGLPATYVWNGGTSSDITDSNNWTPNATPVAGDTVQFDGTAVTYQPALTDTGVSLSFASLIVQYTTTPQAYTFTIDGNNSFLYPTVSLGQTGTPTADTGVDNSILGSPSPQTFNISNGANLNFYNTASADVGSTGTVYYNLLSTDISQSGVLNFYDSSTAGAAIITAGQFSVPNNSIYFGNTSDAETASLTLHNGSILTFTDSSTANSATIYLDSTSEATFNSSADVAASVMTFDNSSILFDTVTTTSTGQVGLSNYSDMTLGQNITLQQLTADATSTIQMNSNTLKVNTAVSGNNIQAVISGDGGIFIKDGVGTDLTLSGANQYTGGTGVDGGTLYVTTTSLPSAGGAYVNANGNLTFDQTAAGTYSGDIATNDSTAIVTAQNSSLLTFSGAITGLGQFVLLDGNAELTNTGNNYSGGTDITNGTLTANSSTLPVSISQPSVTINSAGILEFDQSTTGTYSGDIDLTASNAEIIATGGGTLTLSGAITGSGSLSLMDGYVILTNTGNNYSNGTTISSTSVLHGNSRTIQGDIVDDGEIIFEQNFDGTYASSISSTTSDALITKNGSGILNLTGSCAGFNGTTNVNQGGVALNNVLGGSMNISSGAALYGIGTLLGNLTNHGTVAPGNSIGTLTVNGNYVQGSDGTYEAEYNGTGQSDLINIGGTADLSGILIVYSIDGVLNEDVTYTLLHADGGVQGMFTSVISLNSIFVPTIIYQPNDVLMTVQHILRAIAANHNQRQVVRQLLSITSPTTEESAIISELDTLASSPATIDSARKALSQMSGEQYTNLLFSALATNRQFLRRMYDPLRPLMAKQTGCCDNPYFDDLYCETSPFNFSAWAEGGGGRTFLSHNHNAAGFKASSYKVGGGVQVTAWEDWTFGVAGGYQHDELDYNIGGTGTNNTSLVGAYALYRPGSFYLLGDFTADFCHSEMTRRIDIGDIHTKARSKPKWNVESVYVEFGKDLPCSTILAQPFLGFEFDFYSCNKIREHGSSPLNLALKKERKRSTFSRLGVHLSADQACWSLNVDLAWQCRLTSLPNTLKERFQDFGNQFKIFGTSISRNSLDGAVNISVDLGKGWEIYAEAMGERWSHGSTYNAYAGIMFNW